MPLEVKLFIGLAVPALRNALLAEEVTLAPPAPAGPVRMLARG